ncbi:hypothetical protein [Maritalea sp.]|uniref:hypothetical protein n=1 Tax=Maritalea sp. TaxID=2003361 RepID=UPI003EF48E6A
MTNNKQHKSTKHPQNTARIFQDYEDDEHVLRSQYGFLQDVWDFCEDISDPVYTFLAFKEVTTGKWVEHAVEAGGALNEVTKLLTKHSRYDYDQYFCPNPFSKPWRKRQFALPTRFSWCDIDDGDPEEFDPLPSLVWETSPDRTQGLWSLDQTLAVGEAEQYSKALAYHHGGDKNGWSATKMLRLIGSINHKPQYDEPFVRTISCDWTEIESRPLPLQSPIYDLPNGAIIVDVDPEKHNPRNVLKRYRANLHAKVRYLIGNRTVKERNRSAQVFHMIAGLYEAGASNDEIACVIWDSPYFIDKHGKNLSKLNDEIGRVISKLESKS